MAPVMWFYYYIVKETPHPPPPTPIISLFFFKKVVQLKLDQPDQSLCHWDWIPNVASVGHRGRQLKSELDQRIKCTHV